MLKTSDELLFWQLMEYIIWVESDELFVFSIQVQRENALSCSF